MSIVAYISGHGYGHFTRSAPVLEALARETPVHLRTSDRALALARRARFPATVSEVDVGPGVTQRGPLLVDLGATRAALARHLESFPSLLAEEAAFLRSVGARLVFADVPPLAFAAAAEARIPSVGLGNFSWSWIYEGYAAHDPWFASAAARLAEAESRATCFLELAMGGGLDPFPHRHPIAPVVRRPTQSRDAARARLPFADGAHDDLRPIVLLSFGGFGAELDLARVGARCRDLRLLVVSSPLGEPRENVRAIEPSDELQHQDLVAAVDCVIGKPGYGTVAECLGARHAGAGPTPLCHVPRGEFREYPALVAAIERWLPSAPLTARDFANGNFSPAVARALASRAPEAAPIGDGVAEAAQAIRALLAARPSLV
ncbi:MAG: hypothetical protein EXR72_05325 [Myxococcales bacterium]|nr:hypothetical protein [Myxococcales bacterium]